MILRQRIDQVPTAKNPLITPVSTRFKETLDAYEFVITKLDVREYGHRAVPADVKAKVLEAGRSSPTGMNTQHWRFLLLQEPANITKLARDSTSGKWVEKANFAIIVLTNPKYGFHGIDAGRATQNMQLAAWNYGVVSGIYTGVNAEAQRRDFAIPAELNPTISIGFGYPTRKITGNQQHRLPLYQAADPEPYSNAAD